MRRGRVPKVYGQSMINNCPFCGKVATAKSEQGADVCSKHTKADMLNIKCDCGDYLDLLSGRYGPYFNCLKCGNVKYSKGLERWRSSGCEWEDRATGQKEAREEFKKKWAAKSKGLYSKEKKKSMQREEIVISSRDSYYFD